MPQRVLIVLRSLAVWPVVFGAGISLVFMLHAGRRQQSSILILLFGLWVLSPFVAALGVGWVARRWGKGIRSVLNVMMVTLALASSTLYGYVAYGNLNAKVGFVFLMGPLVSWLFVLLVFGAAAIVSNRTAHRAKTSN